MLSPWPSPRLLQLLPQALCVVSRLCHVSSQHSHLLLGGSQCGLDLLEPSLKVLAVGTARIELCLERL